MAKFRQKGPRQLDMFPELPPRLPSAEAERRAALADLPEPPERAPGLLSRMKRHRREGAE